jgi:hypothetical protein
MTSCGAVTAGGGGGAATVADKLRHSCDVVELFLVFGLTGS